MQQNLNDPTLENPSQTHHENGTDKDIKELDTILEEQKKQSYITRRMRSEMRKASERKIKNFQLRGQNINPIIDASSSILGLIIRLGNLKKMDNIEGFRRKLAEEIKAIETELYNQKYDRATILAHRYALCSAVDEAVMTTDWGADSNWSSDSLLSHFHNETWGGEKFFTILQRLMAEPNRYFELLEFMYVTLTLGFEGMYRVRYHGRDELNQIIEEVSLIIRKEKGDGEGAYTNPHQHIYSKRYEVKTYIPPWLTFSIFGLIMFIIWAGFTISINNQSMPYKESITNKINEAPIIIHDSSISGT